MKIEESTIDRIRTRPRFKIESDFTKSDVFEGIKNYLNKNAEIFEGNVNSETAVIRVKTHEPQLWKPQLELRTETEEDKTIIRGIFGPNSSVWTFFMFLYFAFGIITMIFFTLYFVGLQINSDEYSWCLYAGCASLLMLLMIYFSAKFGQKRSKAELEKLRVFALEAVKSM